MIYRFGECELDTNLYTLQRGGQTIRLRPKVFRVCIYLLEHRDRVVAREELCAQVWPDQFISQATLEGVIRTVRQVVGDSGAKVVLISDAEGIEKAGEGAMATIEMPKVHPLIAPLVYAIPVQLLAYHVAVAKGTDVDQPRNLAKSVTVE